MTTMSGPNTFTATEIARQIDAGTLTAEAVIRAHLERIDKRDADVLAWSHLARGISSVEPRERITPRSTRF